MAGKKASRFIITRISKGIEKAQKKVEERNFETRKSLLEYDEVMDYQRKIFYSRRRKILAGKGLKEIIEEMIDECDRKKLRNNSRRRLSSKMHHANGQEQISASN